MSRWSRMLDPEAAPEARDEAWEALAARARPAILFQLRRRVRGWRQTEEFADQVLERVRNRFEGQGPVEQAALLRVCVEREVELLLAEHGAEGGIDEEFARDWSRGLLGAALDELARVRPETRRLLLRIYDRPEGAPPLTAAELAEKLERPEDDVERALEDARAALRTLFADEIRETVADGADEEVGLLLPQAHLLFD